MEVEVGVGVGVVSSVLHVWKLVLPHAVSERQRNAPLDRRLYSAPAVGIATSPKTALVAVTSLKCLVFRVNDIMPYFY